MTVKTAFTVLLAGVMAVAGMQARAAGLPESCGREDAQFKVKTDKKQAGTVAPETGKAQVIFVESLDGTFASAPTVRFGVDGQWAGADRGASFFAYSLAPGTHHLCASWQGSTKEDKANVGVATLTAEAGKVYVFEFRAIRAEIGSPSLMGSGGDANHTLDLRVRDKPTVDTMAFAQISEDELKGRMKGLAVSTAVEKK